jgi:hypothetical protein
VPTPPRCLVLDTNVVRFAPLKTIEKLAERGFRLRVAETAFLEWCAACVRGLEREGWSRSEARQKLFWRAKSVAPFLDLETPIAVGAGLLTRRIVAEADGLPNCVEADERQRDLIELWRRAVEIEWVDEEFIMAGRVADEFLDKSDANLIGLLRREEELDSLVPSELEGLNATWKTQPEEVKVAASIAFAKETWKLSDAAAERLDAHLKAAVFRMRAAARGARMPKRNDGPDVSLTIHLGDGSLLVTDERRLVDIIDGSGTFQRPWVRHSEDLDDVPEGPPWGESARRQAASFRRRAWPFG